MVRSFYAVLALVASVSAQSPTTPGDGLLAFCTCAVEERCRGDPFCNDPQSPCFHFNDDTCQNQVDDDGKFTSELGIPVDTCEDTFKRCNRDEHCNVQNYPELGLPDNGLRLQCREGKLEDPDDPDYDPDDVTTWVGSCYKCTFCSAPNVGTCDCRDNDSDRLIKCLIDVIGPTMAPVPQPTPSPTPYPSPAPTSPTDSPTKAPTAPTANPLVTSAPTDPTSSPTPEPTVSPTPKPTSPTKAPTPSPSKSPTAPTTLNPTRTPTTGSPTITSYPTKQPSVGERTDPGDDTESKDANGKTSDLTPSIIGISLAATLGIGAGVFMFLEKESRAAALMQPTDNNIDNYRPMDNDL